MERYHNRDFTLRFETVRVDNARGRQKFRALLVEVIITRLRQLEVTTVACTWSKRTTIFLPDHSRFNEWFHHYYCFTSCFPFLVGYNSFWWDSKEMKMKKIAWHMTGRTTNWHLKKEWQCFEICSLSKSWKNMLRPACVYITFNCQCHLWLLESFRYLLCAILAMRWMRTLLFEDMLCMGNSCCHGGKKFLCCCECDSST